MKEKYVYWVQRNPRCICRTIDNMIMFGNMTWTQILEQVNEKYDEKTRYRRIGYNEDLEKYLKENGVDKSEVEFHDYYYFS